MMRFTDIPKLYPNFKPWHTGGGCMALGHPMTDGGHILITNEDTKIPTDDDTYVYLGRYDAKGNPVEPYASMDGECERVHVRDLQGEIDKLLGFFEARFVLRGSKPFIVIDGVAHDAYSAPASVMLTFAAFATRRSLIRYCEWNDPNGCFRDSAMRLEFGRVATTDELRESVRSMIDFEKQEGVRS